MQVSSKIYYKKLEGFRFDARARNILKKLNLVYLGDLAQVRIEQISNFPNIGDKTIEQFENLLIKFGLNLGQKIDLIESREDERLIELNDFASKHDKDSFSKLKPSMIGFIPFDDSDYDVFFNKFMTTDFFELFFWSNLKSFQDEIAKENNSERRNRYSLIYKHRIFPDSISQRLTLDKTAMLIPSDGTKKITRERVRQIQDKVYAGLSIFFYDSDLYIYTFLLKCLKRNDDPYDQLNILNKSLTRKNFYKLLYKIFPKDETRSVIKRFIFEEDDFKEKDLKKIVNDVCLLVPQPCSYEELILEISRRIELSNYQLKFLVNRMSELGLFIQIPNSTDIILQPTYKWVAVANVALSFPDGLEREELLAKIKIFRSQFDMSTERSDDAIIKNKYIFLAGQSRYKHIFYLGLDNYQKEKIKEEVSSYIKMFPKEISLRELINKNKALLEYEYFQVRQVCKSHSEDDEALSSFKFVGASRRDTVRAPEINPEESYTRENAVYNFISEMEYDVSESEIKKKYFENTGSRFLSLVMSRLKHAGRIVQVSRNFYRTAEYCQTNIPEIEIVEVELENFLGENKIVSANFLKKEIESKYGLFFPLPFYVSIAFNFCIKKQGLFCYNSYFSRNEEVMDFSLNSHVKKTLNKYPDFEYDQLAFLEFLKKDLFCTDQEIRAAILSGRNKKI